MGYGEGSRNSGYLANFQYATNQLNLQLYVIMKRRFEHSHPLVQMFPKPAVSFESSHYLRYTQEPDYAGPSGFQVQAWLSLISMFALNGTFPGQLSGITCSNPGFYRYHSQAYNVHVRQRQEDCVDSHYSVLLPRCLFVRGDRACRQNAQR